MSATRSHHSIFEAVTMDKMQFILKAEMYSWCGINNKGVLLRSAELFVFWENRICGVHYLSV